MSSKQTIPLIVAAVTLISLAVGAELINGDDPDTGYFIIAGGVAIIATALVFGPVRQRAEDDPTRGKRTAGVLAGLGVVSLPVFWLGLPAVFGAGAVTVGRDTRTAWAIVVGGLACLLGLTASFVG